MIDRNQRFQRAGLKPTRPDPLVKFFMSENRWIRSGWFEILMVAYGSKEINFVFHFQPLSRAC